MGEGERVGKRRESGGRGEGERGGEGIKSVEHTSSYPTSSMVVDEVDKLCFFYVLSYVVCLIPVSPSLP